MRRTRNLLAFQLMLWIIVLSNALPIQNGQQDYPGINRVPISSPVNDNSFYASHGDVLLQDDFSETLGYNESLWDLESYGNGSVSWIEGEYFNMTAERHSYRTLSSKSLFDVGHEVTIRMSMKEEEAIICVGFTNTTPETGWNYLFWNDSVYFEESQDMMLLTKKLTEPQTQVYKILSGFEQSEFHTYRLVWNSSATIAYVDGERLGAIGGVMPEGPLHFKITITENRNQETEGWLCVDSVVIKEHTTMIDENPPFITLNSPGNDTLNLGDTLIDIVPVGSDGILYWSWDGELNETGAYPYEISLPTSEGLHTLDVLCKDGYGYDNWAHERFIFSTMVTPPKFYAVWSSPTIDGVIQHGEWPTSSINRIEFIRVDGSTEQIDMYFGSDDSFVYIAVDSPAPSGHDSKVAVILNGMLEGRYTGSNETPIITAYYTKGSPQAWFGYDELKYLNYSGGVVFQPKIDPIPTGFLAFSSEQETNVHYEFRFPLEELDVTPGSTIGIGLMVSPSGIFMQNLFYPIPLLWDNASKLAHLTLAIAPNVIIIQTSIAVGAIGLLSVGIYLAYRRVPRKGPAPIGDTELIQRIKGIVESYDRIEIKRVAQMVNLSQERVRELVQQLINQKEINVYFLGEEIMRGK